MPRKLLTFGIILYIVLLFTQPCQDFQDVVLDIKGQTTVARISSPTNSDCEPGDETCSPFCVCGCCGLSVVHHGFTTLAMTDAVTITETTLTPIYQSPSKRTYTDSIWQPPKV